MEANTETSEFESLMFQRGVCAQDRKKPHISHAQGCPGTYTPQHIPITDCSNPSKPPSRDLTTQTTYSWKSFSPLHFAWEVEWSKNRCMDHYYC